VVGASARPGSPGNVVWRNLGDFPGEVIPVTPTSADIDGVLAYRSLRDVPGHVDLAVVAVPASAALDVVRDAVVAGVGACVIVSAGFAETGKAGAELQTEMVRIAQAGGVLLVGPNCLGVQNCDVPLNASLSAGAAKGGGGISVITQSGSYAMALNALSEDEGINFAIAYSSGNRCDVDDAEVIDQVRTDPRTKVICAFLESLGNGELFVEVARRTTAVKPLIVNAVGRSEAGARAAASHTAALAANRRSWDDVLTSVGVVVTRSGLEMLDAARVLSAQPLPAGARAAIITNSGGTGTELSDLLADEGIVLPELSLALRAKLDELLPGYASSANPVDITPIWTRFAELYPAVLEVLARSGEVDIVIPVLLHRSAENADVANALVAKVDELRRDDIQTSVYVCWVARRSAWPVAAGLHEAEIPCFEWPARTARAAGHAVRYADYRRAIDSSQLLPDPSPIALPAGVGTDPDLTRAFVASHGVPVVGTAVCDTADIAVAQAVIIGYPVVAKVHHPNLLHKSDVGGVRVGVADSNQLRAAATDLLALAPGAQVLIQQQVRGIELVVGGLHDETLGPIVAFGLGGVLVEVLDDVSFAPAHLNRRMAADLVSRPRGSSILNGVRGSGPVDRAAIEELVMSVGRLMTTYPEIAELDLNPIMAGPDGVVAVDVRLIRRDATDRI